ncbi:MAG: hypothetical protein JWR38_631 [Mucilaginibacter sp.]|nr:hypothetical protein [Mucilaginibacter sp.]
MKLIILNILFLIFPFNSNSDSRYKNFIHFVSSNYKIPKPIQDNCNWHYAIVKTTIKNKKVVDYKVLNETSTDMKESFKFLIGYQLSDSSTPKEQSLVFCLTIENRKTSCKIPKTTSYTPTEVLSTVMSTYAHQKEVEPNTIFLFNPIISIVDDPIN